MAGLAFLIILLALMGLTIVVPQLLKRFYIPAVVAIMLVGIVIGPNAIDLIGRLNRALGRGYPTGQLYTVVEVIGLLGLVFLMTLAGMEIDLRIIRAEKRAVAWLSALTFFVPAAAGWLVYAAFRPDDLTGKLLYASLFASHSVGLVFPIIRELGLTRTRFGVAVLASTVVTDVASLILLAVSVQMRRHTLPPEQVRSISIFDHVALGPLFLPLFLAAIALYIVLSLRFVPTVVEKVLAGVHPGADLRLTLFILIVLAEVIVGEVIGLNIIVGAFVAGMAIVRSRGFRLRERLLHRKIEGMGYGFLIPFLFLTIGMQTDLRVLFSAPRNALIILFTVVGLVASKIGSGWLAMQLSGFPSRKSLCAGLMTVPQLSATLAAAAVGLELEIIDAGFFNAIVILSIVTTIPVPTLVKLLIVKGKITFDRSEDVLPIEHSVAEDEDAFYG